jgi:hypothetical protein
VNLSQLNSATRRLKGQGVAEVRNTGDDYDDMIEDYLDWLESHNMFLHKTREEEKAQIISDLENGYLHSSEIEYAMGEGKEDNIAKLKQNYKDAIYWSKHERSPQKREAARLVAEKIKRHLQKQYQHSMSEATPMAVQTGEITLTDDEIMEDHLRRLKVYNKKEKIVGWLPGLPRQHSEVLTVDERKYNNLEVKYGFTQEEALSEAERCMRCYYIAMVAH